MMTCNTPGRCTTTTGWLKLSSDVDAEVMFPVEDDTLELARVNPWQFGTPVGNAHVIHTFPDSDTGPQEVSLVADGGHDVGFALNEQKGFLSET